jgi:hypothetical protein
MTALLAGSVPPSWGWMNCGASRIWCEKLDDGFQLPTVDGLALEAVVAGREQLLELGEGQLGERRLAALGEQLGQPEVVEVAVGLEVHDPATVRPEDLELLPLLGIGEDLESGVAVGGVELDLEPGIVERCRLLRCALCHCRDQQWRRSEHHKADQTVVTYCSSLRARTAAAAVASGAS